MGFPLGEVILWGLGYHGNPVTPLSGHRVSLCVELVGVKVRFWTTLSERESKIKCKKETERERRKYGKERKQNGKSKREKDGEK